VELGAWYVMRRLFSSAVSYLNERSAVSGPSATSSCCDTSMNNVSLVFYIIIMGNMGVNKSRQLKRKSGTYSAKRCHS
jgi:hypothetical protein